MFIKDFFSNLFRKKIKSNVKQEDGGKKNQLMEKRTSEIILGSSVQVSGHQNVIAVGSSGTGKTRNVLEPNILQKDSTMIISDEDGKLFNECGGAFNDYELVTTFNPIRYLVYSEDIAEFVLRVTDNKKYATVIALAIMMLKQMHLDPTTEDVIRFISGADENVVDSIHERADPKTVEMYKALVFGDNGNPNEMRNSPGKRMDSSERMVIASLLMPFIGENESHPETYASKKKTVFVNIRNKQLREEYFRAVVRTVSRMKKKKEHVEFILDDMVSKYIPSITGDLLRNGMSVIFSVQSEAELKSYYGSNKTESIIANIQNYVFTGAYDIISAAPSARRLGKAAGELPEAGTLMIISNKKIKCDKAFNIALHENYTTKKPKLIQNKNNDSKKLLEKNKDKKKLIETTKKKPVTSKTINKQNKESKSKTKKQNNNFSENTSTENKNKQQKKNKKTNEKKTNISNDINGFDDFF